MNARLIVAMIMGVIITLFGLGVFCVGIYATFITGQPSWMIASIIGGGILLCLGLETILLKTEYNVDQFFEDRELSEDEEDDSEAS